VKAVEDVPGEKAEVYGVVGIALAVIVGVPVEGGIGQHNSGIAVLVERVVV
jgi:hypothetical protein